MELKDITGFIDIGDVKTIDEFKEKFNEKFAPKTDLEDANKKLSEFTGKFSNVAQNLFKKFGELESKDIEGKKWEEVAEIAINKYKNQVKDLEGKQGQGNDEALKDVTKKLDKISKERDDYKTANETLQGAYDKDKGDWEGKLKTYKVNHILETAKGKISTKLKSDMSAVEKLGFDSVIKDFVIDFDDKETPFVKDKEGKRIPNPNKAGSFLSLEEALEVKANELNLIKKNNGQGGSPINQQFFQGNQQQTVVDSNIPARKVHPSLDAHIEKLKVQQGRR
jgi:cation transport regulator ChaC